MSRRLRSCTLSRWAWILGQETSLGLVRASFEQRLLDAGLKPSTARAADGDLAELRERVLRDLGWQRNVVDLPEFALALGQRPRPEVDQRLGLVLDPSDPCRSGCTSRSRSGRHPRVLESRMLVVSVIGNDRSSPALATPSACRRDVACRPEP